MRCIKRFCCFLLYVYDVGVGGLFKGGYIVVLGVKWEV